MHKIQRALLDGILNLGRRSALANFEHRPNRNQRLLMSGTNNQSIGQTKRVWVRVAVMDGKHHIIGLHTCGLC